MPVFIGMPYFCRVEVIAISFHSRASCVVASGRASYVSYFSRSCLVQQHLLHKQNLVAGALCLNSLGAVRRCLDPLLFLSRGGMGVQDTNKGGAVGLGGPKGPALARSAVCIALVPGAWPWLHDFLSWLRHSKK